MTTKKTSKRKKFKAPVTPVRLTIVERAAAASKYLATVEANVAAYRVAALGDAPEKLAEVSTAGVSLEATIADIGARLEVLARETARINRRLGQ